MISLYKLYAKFHDMLYYTDFKKFRIFKLISKLVNTLIMIIRAQYISLIAIVFKNQ